jgi:hypothetical protein
MRSGKKLPGQKWLWGLASLLVLTFISCHKSRSSARTIAATKSLLREMSIPGHLARLSSQNFADFESGNIGPIVRRSPTQLDLYLRSDNDDALPKFWRQWWYARLDDLPVRREVTLTLRDHGQWMYYLPVYSYDNKNWHFFKEKEVKQPTRTSLRIISRFKHPQVWVARFVPYTYSHLRARLQDWQKSPYVQVSTLGDSPDGHSIPSITITDVKIASRRKKRVIIHSRTHPGEVASSFMLDGAIDFLLSDSKLAKRMRRTLIFDIVPMLNVDGVIAGNNRVNTQGINLEGKWLPSADAASKPFDLDYENVPLEVRLLHEALTKKMGDGVPVTMALNLHSSGGEPEDQAFFFPHFGPKKKGYSYKESRLWQKQLAFINMMRAVQGPTWFNDLPEDGTRAFLAKNVPESWWWRNFADQVMALSIESTYGKAGRTKHWTTAGDMHKMGESLAKSIARYHGIDGKGGS